MQHSIISHLFPPLSASNNSSAALHSTIRKLKLWRIFNAEAISHGSRGVYAEEQNQNFTCLIIYQYDSLVSTFSYHLNNKTTLILRKFINQNDKWIWNFLDEFLHAGAIQWCIYNHFEITRINNLAQKWYSEFQVEIFRSQLWKKMCKGSNSITFKGCEKSHDTS